MIPSIETLLRIKAGNPNAEFHGKTREVYEEFLEKQRENELLEALHEQEQEAPKKKKLSKTQKRVKQILETPTSVAADLKTEEFKYISNERNDEETEEIVQPEKEDEQND